ncbi:MAG: hypothetical protein GQ534_11915 [Candidatus Delongbacteria bacterium]|nr:hypothetical protein [Candidatus Delongbacteria bacterium]
MKYLNKEFYDIFRNRKIIKRIDFFEYFSKQNPNLKKSTFSWRIYDLKQKGIIRSVGRNLYSLSDKFIYKPNSDKEIDKISNIISKNFQLVKYCMWRTGWLNEFTVHQTFENRIILEIEKGLTESVYYFLKDNTNFDLYINPDHKTINYYISESRNAIIIKNLTSRSPIIKLSDKKNIVFPSLEKILVDIFADKLLYLSFQGSELINIFENAINKYSVNYTTMYSYSSRRGVRQDLKQFIKENISFFIEGGSYD